MRSLPPDPDAIYLAALDALEVGDTSYAADVLLAALEDGGRDYRVRCSCGDMFEWPGLLDAHILRGACRLESAA
jgi:hypothetical protein